MRITSYHAKGVDTSKYISWQGHMVNVLQLNKMKKIKPGLSICKSLVDFNTKK